MDKLLTTENALQTHFGNTILQGCRTDTEVLNSLLNKLSSSVHELNVAGMTCFAIDTRSGVDDSELVSAPDNKSLVKAIGTIGTSDSCPNIYTLSDGLPHEPKYGIADPEPAPAESEAEDDHIPWDIWVASIARSSRNRY